MPKNTVSEAQMESRHRQARLVSELTNTIARIHEADSNLEIIEVLAALLTIADRWVKREMADD